MVVNIDKGNIFDQPALRFDITISLGVTFVPRGERIIFEERSDMKKDFHFNSTVYPPLRWK